MKVKLLNINPLAYNSVINDDWILELRQLNFPIVKVARSVVNHTLNVTDYFVDLDELGEEHAWNLNWFIYEEVKEIQD